MDRITSLSGAIDAIVAFDREKFSTMPDHVQPELNRLASVGISPVERLANTAELLYANRTKLTRNQDRELVARLAEYGGENGWFGLGVNGRGEKIAAVMNALAGNGDAPADAPTPDPRFVAPEDQPVPTLPAA